MTSLRAGWQAAALLALNTFAVLIVVNVVAFAVVAVLPDRTRPRLSSERLLEAYPQRSLGEIEQIQRETWGRRYVYEPFTQFKEGAVSGTYVNVDESGFRRLSEGTAWPPEAEGLDVFVFGGSTTFGYGVTDVETIPAALERHLTARGCDSPSVYNLGRSNYFSTQERILFEQQLLAGRVPDVAVFIDGLNEFVFADGEPKFTRRLTYMLGETRGDLVFRSLKQMPVIGLARALIGDRNQDLSGPTGPDLQGRRVLDRWHANRQLIRSAASAFNVHTLFVWQPVPTSGNPDLANPLAQEIPNHEALERGYELFSRSQQRGDLLWLADLGEAHDGALWVDRVHYTASFSDRIADEIASMLAPVLCFESSS